MPPPYCFENDITSGLPVEVRPCDWGKGVFTTAPAAKGAVLWSEPPMAVGCVRSSEGHTCGRCFAVLRACPGPLPKPAVPPGCDAAAEAMGYVPGVDGAEPGVVPPEGVAPCSEHGCEWYCSARCRTQAWEAGHRAVCGAAHRGFVEKLVEALGEKSANQRLVCLKLLTATVAATDTRVRAHADALVPLPYDVVADEAARAREEKVYALFAEAFLPAEDGLLDGVTFEAYLGILSKMKANAVELDLALRKEAGAAEDDEEEGDAEGGPVLRATGLFALQAFVNHSCQPNGHRVFYNGQLHFVGVRGMAEGDQVVMAYVNPAHNVKDRQAKLNSHWRITCMCDKCTAETVKLILFRQLMQGLKKQKDAKKEAKEEAQATSS